MLFSDAVFGIPSKSASYQKTVDEPYQMIANSYIMMQNNRGISAEYLNKRALEQFVKTGDELGQIEAHIALGTLYKSVVLTYYMKSIEHFKKALKISESINDYGNMSISKFGLANAYNANKQHDKYCKLYEESIKDYYKSKEVNPKQEYDFSRKHQSYENMLIQYKKTYCSNIIPKYDTRPVR